jgi:hypothetical protein
MTAVSQTVDGVVLCMWYCDKQFIYKKEDIPADCLATYTPPSSVEYNIGY